MTSYEPVDCTKPFETFQDYEKCLIQENNRQAKEKGHRDFLFIQKTLDKELSDLKNDNYKDIKQTALEKFANEQGKMTKYYMKSQKNSFFCNENCHDFLKSYLFNKNKEIAAQTFIKNSKLTLQRYRLSYYCGFYLQFE